MPTNDPRACVAAVLAVLLPLSAGACGAGRSVTDRAGTPAAATDPVAARYARHCAFCHGADGAGDGPAAVYLYPRPRDFGEGRFRLVRTHNGAPTDADLVGCLGRGMPGAAMPSFAWLPMDDLLALGRHVRELAIARMTADLRARYAAAGRPLSDAEARDVADWRLTPAETVDVPPQVEPTDAALRRGRVVYLERCAACHGADGAGQHPDRAWAAFDGMYWARDLRRGPLKGGAEHADLAHRVLAGMPGVAMPPARFDAPDDAALLLAYLRTLLPPGADQLGVQHRQHLRAVRAVRVPDDPADVAWDDAPPIDVALMALAQRDACIDRAELRALHDGGRLAIRVSWRDPSRDDRAIGGASRFADQCAVQLSDEELPPLFGMGAHETMVDIWHWAAFRARDVVGALDLLQGAWVDAPPPDAPGLLEPAAQADEIAARGLEEPLAVREGAITARPLYRDGRWHVVLSRVLDGAAGGGVELRPGVALQLACAVWNGSAEDVGARKAISIWHELVLE